jgi:hypothetical protein
MKRQESRMSPLHASTLGHRRTRVGAASARRSPGPLGVRLALGALLGVSVLGTPAAEAVAPAFQARHFDLADLDDGELSFSGYRPMALPPRRHLDAYGVPMGRWDGRWVYPMGGLSMMGMSRIVAWQVTGDRGHLRQALRQAAKLREIAVRADGAWWLAHDFAYPPEGMHRPWFNAMTQGLALSFFIRLYHATGDPVHLHAAARVFHSFEVIGRGHPRWVAYVDEARHLWLEHYPSWRPDHVLNAHMHALFGLYEYWHETRSPSARHILEGAITTMRDRLDDYRRPGHISYYCLYHHEVILHYHVIHVWQTELLARISGDPWFHEMSRLLRRDHGFTTPGRGAPGWPPVPDSRGGAT